MDERQDNTHVDISDSRIEALAHLLSSLQSFYRLELKQASESFISAVTLLSDSGDLDNIIQNHPDLAYLGVDMENGAKQLARFAHLESHMGDAYHESFDMLFNYLDTLDNTEDVNMREMLKQFSENN